MKLIFGNMTVDLNIFNLERQPCDQSGQLLDVNLIYGVSNEHFEDEYIKSNFSYTEQNFEKIFYEEIIILDKLDQIINHVSST